MACLVILVDHIGVAHHAALGPFAQRIARQHHLADDLARGEVAHQLHRAGVAEGTVQSAADLRGYAERTARLVRDEHHLVIVPVRGAQQPLAGAIDRVLGFDNLRPPDHEALAEPRAHGFCNVGHRLEIGDAAVVDPVEDLFGAQLRRFLIQLAFEEQLADFQVAEPHEVNTPIQTRRNRARGDDGVNMAGDLHDGRAYRSKQARKRVYRVAHPKAAASIALAAPRRA